MGGCEVFARGRFTLGGLAARAWGDGRRAGVSALGLRTCAARRARDTAHARLESVHIKRIIYSNILYNAR